MALAASAGGLTPLSTVLSGLPGDFPAAIVIVQHLDPRHRSLMADILARRTSMKVVQAQEGDRLRPATVYIAPPDRHLLVNPDSTLSLTQFELVHFVRPSADLLFESVAASFKGPRHRRGAERYRQRRGHGGTGHQEDGGDGDRPG